GWWRRRRNAPGSEGPGAWGPRDAPATRSCGGAAGATGSVRSAPGFSPVHEANLRTALTSVVCTDPHCSPQPGSERSVLLLDVLLHDAERCAAGRSGEVRAGPEALCPPVVADQVGELLAQPPGGDALEAVDQFGHGDLRREVHEQVDVVVLAVELHQFGLEVLTHGPHDLLAPRQVPIGEDLVPVLRHENQVDMHPEDTVTTSTNVLIDTHKPIAYHDPGAASVQLPPVPGRRSAHGAGEGVRVRPGGLQRRPQGPGDRPQRRHAVPEDRGPVEAA